MRDSRRGRATRLARWAWERPWLVLPVLSIAALWPLRDHDLTVSADGTLHLLRLALLDHHVRQGVFFPRWVPELFAGLGYPVFNPWVLWSLRGILTDDQPVRYVLPIGLSLGGLAGTHNITLLFAPFVVVGYVLVVWLWKVHSLSRLAWVIGALVAAMEISQVSGEVRSKNVTKNIPG